MPFHETVSKANHVPSRAARCIAWGTLVLSLTAACSANPGQAPAAPTTQPSAEKNHVYMKPDLTGFLSADSYTDRTYDRCFNTGKRPCAILIRSQPQLNSLIINADPNQEKPKKVDWPEEAFKDNVGDDVEILCYKSDGQLINPFQGGRGSTVWYQVLVPERQIVNPIVLEQLEKPDSTVMTIRANGITSALGWASVEWFGQSEPSPDISEC